MLAAPVAVVPPAGPIAPAVPVIQLDSDDEVVDVREGR